MKKCPRCENEQLKEDYKYCQICGLKLDMMKISVISNLEELLNTNTSLYAYERASIKYAIEELERTAQEVPVQEQ